MEKKWFHVCSKGLEKDILFKDRGAFRAGMNIMALAAYHSCAKILAFALMSNHIHIVMEATEQERDDFVSFVNRSFYSRNAKLNYLEDKVLEKMYWNSYHMHDQKYKLSALAYVLRNPLFVCQNSLFDYEWSSISLYFRGESLMNETIGTLYPVESFKVRELRSLLGSREKVPDDWLMTKTGYIWPGSYVDWRTVESMFTTFKAFAKFLFYTKGDVITNNLRNDARIIMTDQELRMRIIDCCKRFYACNKIRDVSANQRRQIAEQINQECGCGYKQLYRLLNLSHTKK